ncbi:hypothetical protein [Jannaschia pohangensis]|uniref:Peptidase MA superfamily protein n=1 Tax=Jannaschia pohangensis TaxID=390807 RepID=A0A1I3HJW9_9RHOB|nr:hypothetical protein [Jannaschia pohangensis]SFI36068.1 hypothetical protein SAMN04488095_0630 [Jannaschia pohangensis]
MRKRSWLALAVVAGMVAAIVPAFGRTAALPGLHGFTEIAPQLWVEDGAAPSPITREDVETAEVLLADFWGRAPERPRILVCLTEACDAALGGPGPLAQAYGRFVVVLYSRLAAEDADLRRAILTHEMSHVALSERVSAWRVMTGDLPAWLNEGLAVLASDDPRFDLSEEVCATLADETLPEGFREWGRQAGQQSRPLYQAAACRARDWLAQNGLDAL